MPGKRVKVRKNVARRWVTVLGGGVAATAVLLSSGPAAFAKSDMTMSADHKTVKAGKTVRFSGHFGDDIAGGVNGDRICLWEYAGKVPVRQLAPCVPLRQRNGEPLPAESFGGYFTVTVKTTKPGRLVVVPVVDFGHAAKSPYRYAQIPIVVTRAGH